MLIAAEEGDGFSRRGTVRIGRCVSFERVDACVRWCFDRYNGGVWGTHKHRLVNGDNAGAFMGIGLVGMICTMGVWMVACSTDTSSSHLTSQVSVMTETGSADLPPLIAIGNRCNESPFVLYSRVCTLASPSFSPLVSSHNFTLSLRSIIEVCMVTRNGPDLVCDHWSIAVP